MGFANAFSFQRYTAVSFLILQYGVIAVLCLLEIIVIMGR